MLLHHLTSMPSTILILIPATPATHELVPWVWALLLSLPDMPSWYVEYRNIFCGPAQIPFFLYLCALQSSTPPFCGLSTMSPATLNTELQSSEKLRLQRQHDKSLTPS